MHAGPLALTWGGAAGNGAGTINSQKMLPPPPASIHGSNFGTVGAHSYLRLVRRVPTSQASHAANTHPGSIYLYKDRQKGVAVC